MNKYFKATLELIGLQIFFSVLFTFFSEFFLLSDVWKWIYTFITAWLFLGGVHSTFWQMGNKDYKNNVIKNNHLSEGQKPYKLSMFGGLKFGSAFFGINVLIILITLIFDKGYGFGDVLYLIHRIMLVSFSAFIPATSSPLYWPVCFILCIVMYIPCITAYISGAHNFSLTEKIVPKIIYKSSKNND